MSRLTLVPPPAPSRGPRVPDGAVRGQAGRPFAPADQRREVFCVRLSPSDRALLADAARGAGEASLTAWARRVLAEASRR